MTHCRSHSVKVAVFSTKPYDRQFLNAANADQRQQLHFLDVRLSMESTALARGTQVVCAFVNDQLGAPVLEELSRLGIRLIALRSAGFNNVDLEAARELGLRIARVPSYSPHAVAEHTMALILALNRKLHRAYNRVREGNFALEGLLGFDLSGKTVGIVGTGNIGTVLARILNGFGCNLIGNDVSPNPACEELGMTYVSREEIFARADILSLHCPLTPDTHHMICVETLAQFKRGMMLINTSRGAVVETRAAIRGLKDGIIGSLGLDVYEEEADLFLRTSRTASSATMSSRGSSHSQTYSLLVTRHSLRRKRSRTLRKRPWPISRPSLSAAKRFTRYPSKRSPARTKRLRSTFGYPHDSGSAALNRRDRFGLEFAVRDASDCSRCRSFLCLITTI